MTTRARRTEILSKPSDALPEDGEKLDDDAIEDDLESPDTPEFHGDLRDGLNENSPEPLKKGEMTLELLEFLHVLAQTESVTGAATRLRISTPKSSRLLQKARGIFRDELFVRHGKALVPTAFMKTLRPRLAQAIGSWEHLFENAVFRPETYEKTVRVCAMDSALATVLAPAMLEIRRRAPGVRFEVVQLDRDLLTMLANGRIHIGIAPRAMVHSSSIMQQMLYASQYVFVVRPGHPLALRAEAGEKMTREAIEAFPALRINTLLDDESWLMPSPREQAAITMPYMLGASRIIRESDMVLRMTGRLALEYVRSGELVALPTPWVRPGIERALYWHQRTDRDPGLRWIRAMIRSVGVKISDEEAVRRIFSTRSQFLAKEIDEF